MAVRIDAVADRLTAAVTLPAVTAGITVTGWIKRKVDRDGYSTWLRLHTGGTGGGSTIITFGTGSSGDSTYGYYTSSGEATLVQPVPQDVWVPVAVTHNAGTTGSIYARLSGTTYVASGTVNGGTPTGICLGGRDATDTTEWFNGELAQFRIWNTELSQSQIEAEWASATPVITSGLLYNWPLANSADLTDTVAARTLTTQSGGTPTTGSDNPPNVGSGVPQFNLGFFAAL